MRAKAPSIHTATWLRVEARYGREYDPRAASSKGRNQPRFGNPTRFTLAFGDTANLGRVGRGTKTARSWNATNASHNAMSGKARSTSEDDTAFAREMLWLHPWTTECDPQLRAFGN